MTITTSLPGRCACGAPVAVLGGGRFRVVGRACRPCAARAALLEQRAEAAADLERRRRAARLDAPRRAGWSFTTCPRDGVAARPVAAAERWTARYLAAVAAGERAARGANLLVFGPVGVGKTGIAWSALVTVVEAGEAGLFVNARDLLADLRASFGTGRGGELFDAAMRTPLLVLDDLGAERPTAWAVEQLARLVDARHAALLPTVVTSNLGPDALLRHLAADGDPTSGQRIVSRLCEDAEQLHLVGDDRRRAARR